MNNTLKILPALLLLIITTHAQKLPNKQETSVWAPANVKIDGKANEWDDTFQAYNHATDIFYTISNDGKNLYLVAQITKDDAVNKLGKGLTLTIKKMGEKNEKNSVSITYPIYDKRSEPRFTLHSTVGVPEDTSVKGRDIIMHNNNSYLAKAKWIGITGIKGVDSLISVYSDGENRIAAAQLFNNRKVYTLELAVPLSYLKPCINNSRFAYHIQLNGSTPLQPVTMVAPEGSSPQNIAAIEQNNARFVMRMLAAGAPTDLSGEYTLAKKP